MCNVHQQGDEWNLERFVTAQTYAYRDALTELQVLGKKETHWMWFVFPQLKALGQSSMAIEYGIENLAEARAYLAHPVLGPRLIEISQALLPLETNNPRQVMDYPDDLKLRSCMTLFSQVEGADPVFQAVLDKYYGGKPDSWTLEILQRHAR